VSTRRWPLILFALVFAWSVKRWYSHADAESLSFMLAPTAWLVGALVGGPFSFSPGYGWVNRDISFAIVPACAGINFLIIAFGAYACGIVPRVTGAWRRLRWLAAGLAAALVVTLLANVVRVSIAVWLHLHPPAFDRAQLHRIEGSVVYLVFLFGFWAVAQSRVSQHAL
jgi:exosortase K